MKSLSNFVSRYAVPRYRLVRKEGQFGTPENVGRYYTLARANEALANANVAGGPLFIYEIKDDNDRGK